MVITLPNPCKPSDETLEALRLRAPRGLELGYTETDLAEILGVARETVCRWWSAFQPAGPGGLPGKRSGRPLGSRRLLSPGQSAHIRELIDENSPEVLGIASPFGAVAPSAIRFRRSVASSSPSGPRAST